MDGVMVRHVLKCIRTSKDSLGIEKGALKEWFTWVLGMANSLFKSLAYTKGV